MSVRFELDYSDVEQLQEKLLKVPGDVEQILNNIVHTYGADKVKADIVLEMPVSNRNKRHAKDSRPLRQKDFNLGFTVLPKRPYNYLVFPDQALGTSHGKSPDYFMREGLNTSTRPIMGEINRRIDQLLKEEL